MEPKTIGWAIKQLHNGSRVRRDGWTDKRNTVELQVPDLHSKMTRPYLFLRTTDGDGEVVDRVPWQPSQIDLLATDWTVAS